MLSKTAEYALRAIVCVSGSASGPTSADVLAEKTKVPRRYLTRVLQELAATGLVRSRPGPGGGYELAKSPSEITILDVVNATGPLQSVTQCPIELGLNPSLCPLHAELKQAHAQLEAAFAAVTIQALLESTSPIVPLSETS